LNHFSLQDPVDGTLDELDLVGDRADTDGANGRPEYLVQNMLFFFV
jgi:hypothetical protein